ncbi:uncharacterized protein OCT59_020926 [Rhizophagus irregularis]|uniref:BTB domain-containing protein n=2 Tax=Rhizophagus irregularis TaxID=588596 RepID=A0A015LIG1_RHIIW|nr:hypothetical protein GLOIN_2v1874417 [Rhizophagus irregularis DAOM 181602=DAOM 197198]EXX54598.1 hypothetical protein RirG_233170 [Rhizophagus irregularis DAOM 197198w]POG73456.1 hypothetical protein GLOIN_2v1874417 [Rhizophagus irregularis DAOM 181602=DAOM 197198]UZO02446.1 hypothetical protein OCT59_020926 [Rhizophagus irregularis]|eukprot:XP_025180322.1 hypothetical protein GLOIN_2v1874417 [Rhizophagus irregularis DAOM 181602=DAOM 197198]
MDDNKLLQKLSQNLLDILDDNEYYDITIEVGNDPYVKIFRSHMVILNYRSSYLRRILSTNKTKNDETLVHIKLPNILPEIFQTILRYIYGGEPSLKNYDNLDIIKIIVAASELNLQELVAYIQSFLINYKTNWMEQNFSLVYQTSFENDSLLELQEYCTNLISKNPDKIFKSIDFSSIPEKILISLIKSDNLQMDEIKVWENVLKWGLAQNPALSSDPSNYSKDDFNSLKNTLQQCIPFIRFYNLTAKEFSDNILPYKEVLPEELFVDLLKSFLDLHPDSKINHKSKPRMPKEGLPTSAVTIDDERKHVSQRNETSNLWNYAPPKSSRDNALPKGPHETLISSKQNKADYASPKGSLDNVLTSSWEALISGKQNKAYHAPPKGSWSNKPGNEPISLFAPVVPQSAGEWNEDPVTPQSTGGWYEEPVAPQSAGGWYEEPVAPQSAGGWYEEPVAPQSAGGWDETSVMTATGMWDENPVAPVTSWDDVETVYGRSTEKDAQSSTIIENSIRKRKKNKKKKVFSYADLVKK